MQNHWIPLLELFGKLLKCKTLGDALGPVWFVVVNFKSHYIKCLDIFIVY